MQYFLESYAHTLPNFSGDLAPNCGDHGCSLPELSGLESCIADLTGGIDLAYVNLFVGSTLDEFWSIHRCLSVMIVLNVIKAQ